MKFQLAQAEGYAITAHGPDYVRINQEVVRTSFIVFPDQPWVAWSGLAEVTDWSAVIQYAPSVLVIGTGATHHFPKPEQLRPLIEARIGYEIMTTAAACRTYDVLLSEGRRACAAIVV